MGIHELHIRISRIEDAMFIQQASRAIRGEILHGLAIAVMHLSAVLLFFALAFLLLR